MNGIRAPLLLLAVFSLSAVAGTVPDEATGSARHTAECVAALKVSTEDLAVQVKAGHEDLRSTLLARLEQGAAFLGNAYLEGNRDEAQARALLATAVDAQKTLSANALAARQDACSQEGGQLLAQASGFSRAVVSQVARRRMNKLLEP